MTWTLARLKAGYYVLTAIGTIAASCYFNYLFFFLHDRFGFRDRENLGVAALYGAVYMAAAWPCSRFAARRGFHTSLLVGYVALTASMVAGASAGTTALQIVVMAVYSLSLLFIWPALEALTAEHEPPARIPHVVGVYNCTWSGALAAAYFVGGSLYDAFGAVAVFWIPAALFAASLGITLVLAGAERRIAMPPPAPAAGPPHLDTPGVAAPVSPRLILRLAWIANPFSYVAIYTLFAVMPGLATRLGLSPARVGLFCSVWLFGRMIAFIGLWHWNGWHYRFGWLIASYVTLTVTFTGMLLAPTLGVMVLAQVFFGLASGLIYYSSLYYSMDVGDARAEHGGFHEGAIGAGVFAGPAVGALSLSLFPRYPVANAVAVSGLLVCGLVAIVVLWARAGSARQAARRRHA